MLDNSEFLKGLLSSLSYGNVNARIYRFSHDKWLENWIGSEINAEVIRLKTEAFINAIGLCTAAKSIERIKRMAEKLPQDTAEKKSVRDFTLEIINSNLAESAQKTKFYQTKGKEFAPGTLAKAYCDIGIVIMAAKFGDARGELVELVPGSILDKDKIDCLSHAREIPGFGEGKNFLLQTFAALNWTESGQIHWEKNEQDTMKLWTAHFWHNIVRKDTLMQIKNYAGTIGNDKFQLMPLPDVDRSDSGLEDLEAVDLGPGPYDFKQFALWAGWCYKFYNKTNDTNDGSEHTMEYILNVKPVSTVPSEV